MDDMTVTNVQEATRDLNEAGFNENQADAIVRTVGRLNAGKATKADLDARRVMQRTDLTRSELEKQNDPVWPELSGLFLELRTAIESSARKQLLHFFFLMLGFYGITIATLQYLS